MPGGLHARLCHAFLVNIFLFSDLLTIFNVLNVLIYICDEKISAILMFFLKFSLRTYGKITGNTDLYLNSKLWLKCAAGAFQLIFKWRTADIQATNGGVQI